MGVLSAGMNVIKGGASGKVLTATASGLPVLVPPSVTGPVVSGSVDAGATVTLTGTFSDGDGSGNESILVLYQYDDAQLTTGKLALVTAAHDDTFALPSTTANKYLQLEYTPKDSRGAVGEKQVSVVYGPIAVGAYNLPTDNPNLYRWYNFDTDDANILTDKSGNGGPALTLSGSGADPSWGAARSADGTHGAYEFFDAKSFAATMSGLPRAMSVFVAVKQNTRSGQMDALWTSINGVGLAGFRFNVNSSGNVNLRVLSGGTTEFTEVGNRSAPTNWMVFGGTVGSIDASNDRVRLFSDAVKLGETSTAPVANFDIPDTLSIGPTNMLGYIGEVVICNAELTEAEALSMSNYLINKWA